MAEPNIVNGVNVDDFQKAVEIVGGNPEAQHAPKSSRVRWIDGLKFKAQVRNHTFIVDEPAHLTGEDESPNSMEYVLGAYGACLATGFVINATKRGIHLRNLEVSCTSTQNNVYNFLGLTDEGHPGFDEIRAKLFVQADGDEDTLREIWEQTIRSSPVHNSLVRPVNIVPEVQIF